jgi:hypothetical protein
MEASCAAAVNVAELFSAWCYLAWHESGESGNSVYEVVKIEKKRH